MNSFWSRLTYMDIFPLYLNSSNIDMPVKQKKIEKNSFNNWNKKMNNFIFFWAEFSVETFHSEIIITTFTVIIKKIEQKNKSLASARKSNWLIFVKLDFLLFVLRRRKIVFM